MKALKVLGVIIFILIAVFLVVPLFLADNVIISHTEVIKAEPQTIFHQVNDYHKWSAWSPFESDTTMVNSYSGPEQGVGASRTWSGKQVGEGSMTIVESIPYTYIKNTLVFGPDEGGGTGSWNFVETDGGVEVTWTTHITDLTYPVGRWFGIMMEPMLKPMLESGLKKLKSLSEAMPAPPEIKIINLEAQPSLVIYDSTDMQGMSEMLSDNFKALFDYVKARKVPVTGQHFAIYHKWNPEGISIISCGIPVAPGSKGRNNVKYFEIPGGNAVFASHTGGMDSSPTHYAIDQYIKDFQLDTKDYIWEVYLYDPEVDKDPSKYVTFIYYPLN